MPRDYAPLVFAADHNALEALEVIRRAASKTGSEYAFSHSDDYRGKCRVRDPPYGDRHSTPNGEAWGHFKREGLEVAFTLIPSTAEGLSDGQFSAQCSETEAQAPLAIEKLMLYLSALPRFSQIKMAMPVGWRCGAPTEDEVKHFENYLIMVRDSIDVASHEIGHVSRRHA
ncbi:MAG: hypothetical protein V1887_04515 [Candidatus Aenigmatarchaeota archaeon]